NSHGRARRAIAVMTGEMQEACAARDLRIQREVVAEPVLPVGPEAEIVEIELARLRLVENAENGNGSGKGHGAFYPKDAGCSQCRHGCLRSRRISRAALWPGSPVTPPPG